MCTKICVLLHFKTFYSCYISAHLKFSFAELLKLVIVFRECLAADIQVREYNEIMYTTKIATKRHIIIEFKKNVIIYLLIYLTI